MTKKQKNDIECIKYFIPDQIKNIEITNQDIKMFLEYSDKGLHKDKAGTWAMGKKYQNGFNALIEGKQWRGIHMRMWEEGVRDGTMPYITLLETEYIKNKKKWYEIWKPKYRKDRIPDIVIDFMKKEMFKGRDSAIIEYVYHSLYGKV